MRRVWVTWLIALSPALATEPCSIRLAHASESLTIAIESPYGLQLAGQAAPLSAQNTYFSADGSLSEPLAATRWEILRTGAAAQHDLDQTLRERFAQAANVFPSGDGGVPYAPAIHGAPLFLEADRYRQLVQSTAPTLRAFRALLQEFLSGTAPPGAPEIPAALRTELFARMRESLYYERKLHHPSLRDYPFLGVVGFDAALASLASPAPIFYELNAGTPSGMGNNVQLTELLFQQRPEWAKAMAAGLPSDNSFTELKRVIDANALAWTGNAQGISVIVSPGPYNAFHPDVVQLALRTGLSLVRPEDLYEDRDGSIRLDTGYAATDPVVTGIYSRMEESYLLANVGAGLPARGPHARRINDRLATNQSRHLEPGVLYRYFYNAQGEAQSLDLSSGQPEIQEIFGGARGLLLRAVHSRKLYISNLGGRLIDDKRLFNAVARGLAPYHLKPGEDSIAAPPLTLDTAEVRARLDAHNPDFNNLVVKEAEGSGGSGVYFVGSLTPDAREKLLRSMRSNPQAYVVQEIVHSLVHLSADRKAWTTRAFDCRIFVCFDAEGKVNAGSQSLLLRVAGAREGRSNTSSGGGYGIALVLEDQSSAGPLPPMPTTPRWVPTERRRMRAAYLDRWETLLSETDLSMETADELITEHLAVMDLLGAQSSPLLNALREYRAGRIQAKQLRRQAHSFLSLLDT